MYQPIETLVAMVRWVAMPSLDPDAGSFLGLRVGCGQGNPIFCNKGIVKFEIDIFNRPEPFLKHVPRLK